MSFCWQCGGRLNRRRDGSDIFAEVMVDGAPRKVHRTCAGSARYDERQRTMTRLADEVPLLVRQTPEVRYG